MNCIEIVVLCDAGQLQDRLEFTYLNWITYVFQT